ncbi:MAG: methyltransferase domain-containing protein [Phycisphaerales bacterium]|nr:methyltransferase domain-containing protein [Phycisphaerales bacterium]
MPARLDNAAAARSVISRAEQFVARWPGGYGRTLWQRVAIIQDEPADLALGLWFACAGAQVQLCCPDASPWVRERDDGLMPILLDEIARREPRLLTQPLEGLQHNNYHRRWGFAYLQGRDAELAEQLTGPVEVVLFDGLDRLSGDPREMLKRIHERTQWSSSIEILPRTGESDIDARLDAIRQAALEVGFGCTGVDGERGAGLSLVRLGSPMSDHPVLDDPTIMAHCFARLDVAAALAKNRTILDAGGWAGLGAERYLKAGAKRVVNLDISTEALELGRQRLGDDDRVEFVQWDLNQSPLPFEEASFDLVVCLEALEHITQQRQAVAEFERVLKPGGLLLVSVPDQDCEETWARLNQHDNAFHLHVPTRGEFEALLARFESIRWLRQADVTGSIVLEDSDAAPTNGRFEIVPQWSARQAQPQVIMALCAKQAGASRKARRAPRVPASDLRVYGSQSDRIVQMRIDEATLDASVRKERLEWWSRANALEAKLRGVTADLEAARSETRQWRDRVQTDEKVAALEARFDATHKAIESIAAELAQSRAQREQESRRWQSEIHHHANVLNEAQRQRFQASTELEKVQRQANEQSAQVARLTSELAAAAARNVELAAQLEAARESARKELAQERARREADAATHAELAAAVKALTTRLDDDRRTLLQRVEALLAQSLEVVDRRCLTVEGKVYDLQDDLDRPAVSPHRNGSPSS